MIGLHAIFGLPLANVSFLLAGRAPVPVTHLSSEAPGVGVALKGGAEVFQTLPSPRTSEQLVIARGTNNLEGQALAFANANRESGK
ncbi:MAG: hypothetical protein ACK42L_05490, partial [Thermoanaerobaculum sp.]